MNPLKKAWRKLTRPTLIVENGVKLFLGPVAQTRCANGIYSGKHELPEREVVGKTLCPNDVVLEIGAGVGMVTLQCCRQIGADRVHTCEANPALLPVLKRSCELNGFAPELISGMVGLEAGSQEFFVAKQFVSSSRYAHDASVEQREQTVVPVLALSALLARIQPTYLIMDAEGAEADLLDPRVNLGCLNKVCVEVHPKIIGDTAINQIVRTLADQGLHLSWSQSRGVVLFFERSKPAPALAGIAA
jgi:FkbM family methyltransferase